ncbi:ssDNA endonuclease and repair protein rad10 [Cryptotrichosporon argae]
MNPRPAPAPATSFQPASTLPRPGASNRDASGGLPPIRPEAPTAPIPPGVPPAAGPSTSGSRPIHRPAASKNAIVYNAVQRRNPVLGSIKNVGIEIGDIVADYQVGAHNGILFLSLKYHRLHPEYIHQRIEKMRGSYNVRIMLVLCDITEHQESLRELAKIAIVNHYTVFVAWSNEEAAQYLTTFKAYEHKSADTLKERVHQTYPHQLEHVLTSGRKVNKSDTEALAAAFGSFANMTKQSNHALGNVKGLGPVKVVSLLDAFNKPFLVGGLARRRGQASAPANADETSGGRTALAREGASGASGAGEATGPGDGDAQTGQTSSTAEHEQAPRGPSPDWSDSEPAQPAGRQRARAPSRSPSPAGQVWADPLGDDDNDDDDGKDDGDDAEDEDGPAAKRART